ncbi:MAG: aminopeptidase P family protein [Prevotella sp.]|nr:aminopeptidase P family protein [Prevotella sp.]
MTINEKLQRLREEMQREHLAAYIFTSTDPHNGEYVPEHWKSREWISGFNGSAGTAVVTMTSAALWTDSRYFLAAEEQLRGTEFQLMRLKMPETPTIPEWIKSQFTIYNLQLTEVAIDGSTNSAAFVEDLIEELRKQGGLTLRTNYDPLRFIWNDRPPIPENPVELHPLKYAGEDTPSKLRRIRESLRQQHADGMLVSALDDIAWTLNLRGSDVHCNPVFVAYLLISSTKTTLFVNPKKLSLEVKAYLADCGVEIDDYGKVQQGLRDYFEYNILLDPNETSYTLMKAVQREIVREKSPIPSMKIVKNATEIEGFRRAMVKDGVAMVRFLMWLEKEAPSLPPPDGGGAKGPSEMSIAEKLTAFRAEQPDFRGISFDTISGYEQHGAIVHYEATPETDIPVENRGFLLLDSGAQYLDGTTDITRTIALGPLTDEQRHVYTLVLRGHIQLARCIFPRGAAGTQLDVLARQFMWREAMNYLHGTGHGVGQYLCVHEGPHQIRMEWKPTPFVEGMIVTDEPGLYLPDRFGVRIENMLVAVPYAESEFGQFLQFEPLTLCPIDTAPIILSELLPEEIAWLNDYHQRVRETLSPHLTADEQAWLREATQPI